MGKVFCDGSPCLVCLDLLDQQEIARDGMSPEQRDDHDRAVDPLSNRGGVIIRPPL